MKKSCKGSKLAVTLLTLVFSVVALTSTPGGWAFASEAANPLFGYTHLEPSPFTLPAGRGYIGTDLAYGITDFLQLGTSLIRDASRLYNANAKLSLIDAPAFAAALTGNVDYYNLQDIDPANPDVWIRSWQPGVTTAYALGSRVAIFLAGNLNLTDHPIDETAVRKSGYLRGGDIGADISWAYNPPSRRHRVGNVLSAGVTYNTAYHVFGFGVSHHWPGFHIGIHYYPSVAKYPVQPILEGGMSF